MNIIQRIYQDYQSGKRLEDIIPEGASLKYWKRVIDNYNPNFKPKPKQRRRCSRTSRTSQQAAMYKALAVTVERVNSTKSGPSRAEDEAE